MLFWRCPVSEKVRRSMRSFVAPDICIVTAKKDNAIEYWAAATVREKAVAEVEQQLLPGWTAMLTRRHLTTHRATRLKILSPTFRGLQRLIVVDAGRS
jgi:hypothetical protein